MPDEYLATRVTDKSDKGEATLSALLLVNSTPSPSRDLISSIASLLHLSKLRLLLPVLTTLSVCTYPTVEIIGDNLTRELEPELNENPNKEDTKSSIISSPAKSTDWFKYLLNPRASTEIDTKTSLSLSSATSCQESTSGSNP
ncbi:hypothetical protein AYI68_g1469 [Smittium mucronatum]|uniref:Uncharacterized protein n=1 Tax=Smittium mucronatum TaxID=133383 RepID=A0A1R0H5K1_9FUNG|nr:hypothetical protein AYI68_g1469 [Smittium mucronatum]